ncbi:hypothetical protein ACNOYE_07370 [Nannocystaceae bacterium ST9]
MTEKIKPTDLRGLEREQEKAHGRDRRAELLLDAKAKEAARHDVLENRVATLDERLTSVERRLDALESSTPANP